MNALSLKTGRTDPKEIERFEIQELLEHAEYNIVHKTPSQAIRSLQEAWKLAERMGEDILMVEILQLQSKCETPKFRTKWIQKAIELAQNSEDQRLKRCIGGLYERLGWMEYEFGKHQDSLAAFKEASKSFSHHGNNADLYRVRVAVGRQLRATGDTAGALEHNRELLSELDGFNLRDARLFEELAECLFVLGKVQESRTFFAKAYLEFSSDNWVPDNQTVRLKRMKDMGKEKKYQNT